MIRAEPSCHLMVGLRYDWEALAQHSRPAASGGSQGGGACQPRGRPPQSMGLPAFCEGLDEALDWQTDGEADGDPPAALAPPYIPAPYAAAGASSATRNSFGPDYKCYCYVNRHLHHALTRSVLLLPLTCTKCSANPTVAGEVYLLLP